MSDPTVPSQPAQASLGAQAARGVAWTTAPAVLAKMTGFAADIALAWFLTKQDFGAVGLSIAVAALFSTIQQAGLRDILTQRQKRFRSWATPAFWMAISLGVLTMCLMAASAPLAALLFDSPTLKGLILLLSVRCLIDAFAIVPQAKLQAQLRYRAIGAVAACTTLVQAGCSVLLASKLFGWGSYAMAAPMVLTSLIQAAAFWWLADPSVETRVQLPRWRWLGRDAGFAIAAGLVTIAVGYGDNAVLGLFRDDEIVGVYFFAYRLAVQANQLLVTNLSSVVFAALTRLDQDRLRQRRAAMSAARMLAILAVPVNLVQAAAAEPLFRMLYHERWLSAVRPFQLLSLAMALALIGAPSGSLIRAQGRFKLLFVWSACISVAYLLLIGTGAAIGGAVGVACAAVVYYGIFGPAGLRLGVGKSPGFWREVAEAFLWPLALGGSACAIAWYSRLLIPGIASTPAASAAWILLISFGLYALFVRFLLRSRWDELMGRLLAAVGRRGTVASVAVAEASVPEPPRGDSFSPSPSLAITPQHAHHMNYVYDDLVREDILRMIPPDGSTIGSIGCGHAATEAQLVRQGKRVLGVDVSPHAVAAAKERLTEARLITPDDRAPFPPDSLDGLILADVIEHIPAAWDALAEYAKSVRPGGWVVISVPNMRNLFEMRQYALGGDWPEHDMGIFDRTHVQFMTHKRLERWIKNAGLVVERWFDRPDPRHPRLMPMLNLMNALFFKRFSSLLDYQIQVRCRRPSGNGAAS